MGMVIRTFKLKVIYIGPEKFLMALFKMNGKVLKEGSSCKLSFLRKSILIKFKVGIEN